MYIKTKIESGSYYDSVKLMLVTQKIKAFDGIIEAAVVMGTELNKETLERTGLITEESNSALPNDMIIAISGETEAAIEAAMASIDGILNAHTESDDGDSYRPKSLSTALTKAPKSNVTIISIPGVYAKAQAMEALKKGLHVMLFSDNVPVEDEIELKEYAVSNDLLVMGPDCGTAVINNVALGFANKVRKGNIGIVAAAGTGLQEVMTLVHNQGYGISQAIGTGGRDLSLAVGGRTMLQALDALNSDDETQVIVLVSKPPAEEVMNKITDFLSENVTKPVVINFIGKDSAIDNVIVETSLEDAALAAIALLEDKGEKQVLISPEQLDQLAATEKQKLNDEQKYVRGLFSGGTLNYETIFTLKNYNPEIHSNTSAIEGMKLEDSSKMIGHCCIDLGEDEFTVGRPHPMIDPSLRVSFLEEELLNPETAVILLDIVLGYGANAEPAKPFVDVLAKHQDRNITVISSICGSDDDPQGYARIQEELESAGVIVMPSNKSVAMLAGKIIQK